MRATELLHTLSCWCYRMCTTTRLCSTVETSHCGSREGTSALRLLTWHDVMAQAAEHGRSSGCSGLHLSLHAGAGLLLRLHRQGDPLLGPALQ